MMSAHTKFSNITDFGDSVSTAIKLKKDLEIFEQETKVHGVY